MTLHLSVADPVPSRGRAIAAGLLVTALIAGVLAMTTARATTTVTTSRLSGGTRFGTAQSVANAGFTNAETVLLASGRAFADALAGAYYAGTLPGPILLTERGALPAETKSAIAALHTKNVVILGGNLAVSDGVANELQQTDSTASGGGKLTVRRIAGGDRYDTARAVATEAGADAVGTSDGKKTAFLTNGLGFADALAAGPLAVGLKFPILLTDPSTPSSAAKQAFGALGVRRIIILGGPTAVSEGVAASLRQDGYEVLRIGGGSRQDTAALLADTYTAGLQCRFEHVAIARGDDFPDALAGGPRAGLRPEPILLTINNQTLGSQAQNWLATHRESIDSIEAFGGTGAVTDQVLEEARQAAFGNTNASSTTRAASTSSSGGGSTSSTAPHDHDAPHDDDEQHGGPVAVGGCSAGASCAAAHAAAAAAARHDPRSHPRHHDDAASDDDDEGHHHHEAGVDHEGADLPDNADPAVVDYHAAHHHRGSADNDHRPVKGRKPHTVVAVARSVRIVLADHRLRYEKSPIRGCRRPISYR